MLLRWTAGLLASLLAACAAAPTGPFAGATTSVPQSAVSDVAWLDRLTWGATPSSALELRRFGREAWLQRQLQPNPSAVLPRQSRRRSVR